MDIIKTKIDKQLHLFDNKIEKWGYKKLSDKTWSEHCEKCKSHDIFGCAELRPHAHEFFDYIVFQKIMTLGKIKNVIIEIARPPKEKIYNWELYPTRYYSIGFIYSHPEKKHVVRRMIWELLDEIELTSLIKQCEEEIKNIIN